MLSFDRHFQSHRWLPIGPGRRAQHFQKARSIGRLEQRLTADGKIRTCLFSVTEHDVRSRLRRGDSDDEIADYFKQVVWGKEAGHRIGQPDFVPASRSMSCIGG